MSLWVSGTMMYEQAAGSEHAEERAINLDGEQGMSVHIHLIALILAGLSSYIFVILDIQVP